MKTGLERIGGIPAGYTESNGQAAADRVKKSLVEEPT